ncbi:MAG: FtsX-like permease family protein [Saprospiraceae bacterium]|nr:FtsX-like permease family protein [Saprospiraceae bacterium]
MIAKVAWRNIWRSRTRTAVVVGAVILAIWALVFMIAFVRGVVYGYIDKAVQFETSHVQLHNPAFLEEPALALTIPEGQGVMEVLAGHDSIVAWSPRIVVNAMLATSTGANGIQLRGVDPQQEHQLTRIGERVVEGVFFDEGRNQVVLSTSLAAKLNVGLRKKVIVTFQDQYNNLTSAAFRVIGLYDTDNRNIDDVVAFVRADDLRAVAGMETGANHEMALLASDVEMVPQLTRALSRRFPDLTVRDFEEISPDLGLFKSQVQINLIIMTVIIMLALIFGIINTMLMAVLERTRELGMLMAIGMNKARVFGMVVIETMYVSLLGAPVGLALGWATVLILNRTGIDLSNWSSGLAEFGMATLVYPVLETDAYVVIVSGILITALLASIYPSLKAIRLRPVEALRKL